MSDEMRASVDAMRDASRRVRGKADDIRAGVDRINKTMVQLLGDDWQGWAASDYDRGWTDWKKSADDVVEGLYTSADLLADNANRYEAQDTATAHILGRITPGA